MGSDESHFNVSVGSGGQSHKTVSSNHNLSEEKGEPKRIRTEVLPLTSLTPYRYAKPAHSEGDDDNDDDDVDDDDDCFYTALFTALEQTHCAGM